MSHSIDLMPFRDHPDAAVMLHLARGQLNRAYRHHGLLAPNPVAAEGSCGRDPTELDDPVALGLEQARATYHDAFATWEASMPAELVGPVLEILRKTHAALLLQQRSEAARAALVHAQEILEDVARGRG